MRPRSETVGMRRVRSAFPLPTTIMAKGKSRTNFAGVSRFLDALKTDTGSTPLPQTPSPTLKEMADDGRPTKKRKTDTPKLLPSDSAYESYDATGLVPFYTESSQVPEDLQKCTFAHAVPDPNVQNHACIISLAQISLNGADISRFMTRAVS